MGKGGSDAFAVIPEDEVEAVTKAHAMPDAEFGNGGAGGVQRGAGGGAGHEDDAFLWQAEGGDGLPVLRLLHDEFEPAVGQGGKPGQHVGPQGLLGSVAGVPELGGDVPLVDARGQGGAGAEGAVAFNFHKHVLGQQAEQVLKGGLLHQGFTSGDDEVAAVVGEEAGSNVFFIHVDPLAPGVLGVTPAAAEVAAGQAQEDGGRTHAGAFSLQGIKDFRLVVV